MIELETPFPYQEVGARFLAATPQALLADEMGLGKSAQAVIASDLLNITDVLVLCPAAVRINWSREWQRFSPLDRPCFVVMSGKDKLPPTGVVVCSYDLAGSEKIRQQLMRRRWHTLVLDEAHFLKSRTAHRTRVAYGHGKRSPGLISVADRVWRLSGTPMPNYADELWTHMKSAGITDISYWDFVARYCNGFDSGFGFKITGNRNTDELKRMLSTFMLRRKKDDVMKELPPITFQEVTVERGDVDFDLLFFERLLSVSRDEVMDSIKRADDALRSAIDLLKDSHAKGDNIVKLLASFSNEQTISMRRYIGMAKLKAIIDIVAEELASGAVNKIVLFAIHRDVIEGLRVGLSKYGAVTLYGKTDPRVRQRNIDRFMQDPKCRVFIGNIAAAGTGITLTSASEVAFVEADWVPGNNAQAAMRCHRIGQTRPVRVRFFSCAGSSDEDVMRVLRNKTREQLRVFD